MRISARSVPSRFLVLADCRELSVVFVVLLPTAFAHFDRAE